MVGAEQTKERILKAAIEIFARDGFAGAHVAEIAERAEANVALIYRYFDSKEGLLEAILNQVIEAWQTQRDTSYDQQPMPSSPEQICHLISWAWGHLQEQRDLLKIMLFESLRGEKHNELLFEVFDAAVMRRLSPGLIEQRTDETLQLAMAIFFFGSLPVLMAILTGEQMATHYGIEPERMREHFLKVYEAMYARPILDLLGIAPQEKSEKEEP